MGDITTAEAASRLGVSTERVAQMLRRGDLRGRRLTPRLWLVDLASVHERARLAHRDGRPWSRRTADEVLEALSTGAAIGSRSAELISSNDADRLWRRVSQLVEVRRFDARDHHRATPHLALTGPSAAKEIGADLVGEERVVHGYVRNLTIDEFIDAAELVERSDGAIAVHRFKDGRDPARPSRALIAVDCARDSAARVRRIGTDALETMRMQWLSSNT
jgi:excisionase family DNA binding protein